MALQNSEKSDGSVATAVSLVEGFTTPDEAISEASAKGDVEKIRAALERAAQVEGIERDSFNR